MGATGGLIFRSGRADAPSRASTMTIVPRALKSAPGTSARAQPLKFALLGWTPGVGQEPSVANGGIRVGCRLSPPSTLRMSCTHCSGSATGSADNPFRDLEALASDTRFGACLALCSWCGQPAVHFWVGVYDDTWRYWCLVDESEREALRSAVAAGVDDSGEPLVCAMARRLIRQRRVLSEHPIHGGFSWHDGINSYA
jgi:hypothetical protein